MYETGPISNYAPYLWAAFAVGAAALIGFMIWTICNNLELRKKVHALRSK
jgi:heme exporter protein CcmD